MIEVQNGDFVVGDVIMSGWESCNSKYAYAKEIERLVRSQVSVGGKLLMLGLGGGVLCGTLDDYDMTSVPKNYPSRSGLVST
jgi:hypothetical protein